VEQLEEIEDSLVIGQDWKNDVRVILFVKMMVGHSLTEALKQKIRQVIRANASPRHVPAKIIEVPAIPYTLNMKKVELAVKKVIQNQPVNQQLFSMICATSIGFNNLDRGACAQSVFNSNANALTNVPTDQTQRKTALRISAPEWPLRKAALSASRISSSRPRASSSAAGEPALT
jgi:hypothetical protein